MQSGKLRGHYLDARMVQTEQSKVQEALDKLEKCDPAAYNTLISERNAALNPTGTTRDLGNGFPTGLTSRF